MTEMEKVEARILELEYSVIGAGIQLTISVSNIHRGDNCWIADVNLDGECTIHNCEYPDKYFEEKVQEEKEVKCATNTPMD